MSRRKPAAKKPQATPILRRPVQCVLTDYDRDRIAGYLTVLGRHEDGTPRYLGYEYEATHVMPHPIDLPRCGLCGAELIRCGHDIKHKLPPGVPFTSPSKE